MKKINLLFLLNQFGLGGGERVISSFNNTIDQDKFNAYLGVLNDSKYRRGFEGKEIHILENEKKIIDFIKENNVEVIVSLITAEESLIKKLKKHVRFLQIVNFSHLYSELNDMNLFTTKTDFLKIKLLNGKKILPNSYVLYHPIDYNKWEKLKNDNLIKPLVDFFDSRIVVGRLGRAEPSKWHYLILSTLMSIKNQNKFKKYRFVFAGMPKLYKWFIRIIFPREVRDRSIVLLPELSNDNDVASFYKSLDVFFQTAWVGESFGLVIAESMVFELPVISDFKNFIGKNKIHMKKYDAQIELIDKGETGYYARHPRLFINKLDKLKKEQISKFGKSGNQKIKTIYETRMVTKNLENLIFKSLKISENKLVPDEKETYAYEKIYKDKIRTCIKEEINKLTFFERVMYDIGSFNWRVIEWIYIIFRKILLKFGKNIEK